ncbi:hypothetical protein LEN26_002209 [Aphanomyces euteiches]|nr:hypothetical protein LEN26_002209 [Aphanomyces euteiches]
MATVRYPYRPKKRGMARATSYESILAKLPPRPTPTQPFHALTREDMGWSTASHEPQQEQQETSSKLTQQRESGWNTSFPAEYSLVPPAVDFRSTLSYTQHKLRDLEAEKQLLQASASAILASDIHRNHSSTTLSHLHAAFHCGSDDPLLTASSSSNAQDEIRLIKAILIRDGLVLRLHGMAAAIHRGDHSSLTSQGPSAILQLLLDTRDASLRVVHALSQWFQAVATPRTYMWHGSSYVHRMLDDLNFLGDVPVLADALGVAPRAMKRNPFMMPCSIADRDLEPFRYMLQPPPLTRELFMENGSETTAEAVAQGDAFFIWACIHLPHESSSNNDATPPPPPPPAIPPEPQKLMGHVLEWQTRAETQLKLLAMPLESPLGLHASQVVDSSPMLKRKGHLPALSSVAPPPSTLHDLMHQVHDPPPPSQDTLKKKSIYQARSAMKSALHGSRKYAHVKPRVSAEAFPHKRKQRPSAASPPRPSVRRAPKAPPVVLSIDNWSVSSVELQALSRLEAPPHVVALVMTTVLMVVSPGDFVPKDVSWTTSRQVLSQGAALLRSMAALSREKHAIAPLKLKALAPFVGNDKFRPESLQALSRPAAALCAWVLDLVAATPVPATITLDDPPPRRDKNDHEDAEDRTDLLEILDADDTNPASRAAPDVLVLHEASGGSATPRLVYQGSWTYHDLVYAATFYLDGHDDDSSSLLVQLEEPRSGCQTEAKLTLDEMTRLFGSVAAEYAAEHAWIELCQLILSRLDRVIEEPSSSSPMTNDEEELWQALATPRSEEESTPPPVKRPPTTGKSMVGTPPMPMSVEIPPLKSPRQAGEMPGSDARPRLSGRRSSRDKRRQSLVATQSQFAVDVEPEGNSIEHHAKLGMRTASRHRLSNAKLEHLQAMLDDPTRVDTGRREQMKQQGEDQQREPQPQHDDERTQVAATAAAAAEEAAIQIQCMARQKFARDHVERLKQQEKEASAAAAWSDAQEPQEEQQQEEDKNDVADDAAIQIQCMARQKFARDYVQHLLDEREASLTEDASIEAVEGTPRHEIQQDAQLDTPPEDRHEDRKEAAADNAAIQIQCMARQKLARDHVQHLREEKEASLADITTEEQMQQEQEPQQELKQDQERQDADVDGAATLIQCMARQKVARDHVQRLKDERKASTEAAGQALETPGQPLEEPTDDTTKQMAADDAAIQIQCLARQKLARDRVQHLRDEKEASKSVLDELENDKTQATTDAASTERSNASQEELQEPQDEQEELGDDALQMTPEEAAIQIQCMARQKLARNRVEQLKQEKETSLESSYYEEFEDDEAAST